MSDWSHQSTPSVDGSAFVTIREAAQDAISGWDRETLGDLKRVAAAAAEGIREGAVACRKSASNTEDGLDHATSISDEFSEKADNLQSQADQVEHALDPIVEWDEENKRDEIVAELLGEKMVWQVVSEDGCVITDEVFDSQDDALGFIDQFCEQTGDDPAELVPEEISATYDVEFDRLPEDVRNEVESRLEDARQVWADEAVSALEDALRNVSSF